MRFGPTAFVLTALAIAAAGVVLAFTAPVTLRTSMAGTAPSTVDVAAGDLTCGGLGLPFASDVLEVADGRVRGTPPPGVAPGLPDDVDVEVRGGAVVAWTSDAPVRAVLVVGTSRINLYRYEPVVTADADLRAPVAPDGRAAAVLGVEICRSGPVEPDLAEVCIRAGHVPVAGPSTYADGRFDEALGPGFAAEVDPDDGTLSWRSDGTPVSAVVTATNTPVLVEYDPPVTSGADVPFLGARGTTGRVQLCGVVLAAD